MWSLLYIQTPVHLPVCLFWEKDSLNPGAMFIWVLRLDSESFCFFFLLRWWLGDDTKVSNPEPRLAAILWWIQVFHELGLRTVFDTYLTH